MTQFVPGHSALSPIAGLVKLDLDNQEYLEHADRE